MTHGGDLFSHFEWGRRGGVIRKSCLFAPGGLAGRQNPQFVPIAANRCACFLR